MKIKSERKGGGSNYVGNIFYEKQWYEKKWNICEQITHQWDVRLLRSWLLNRSKKFQSIVIFQNQRKGTGQSESFTFSGPFSWAKTCGFSPRSRNIHEKGKDLTFTFKGGFSSSILNFLLKGQESNFWWWFAFYYMLIWQWPPPPPAKKGLKHFCSIVIQLEMSQHSPFL